jgi:hypothetical protein
VAGFVIGSPMYQIRILRSISIKSGSSYSKYVILSDVKNLVFEILRSAQDDAEENSGLRLTQDDKVFM